MAEERVVMLHGFDRDEMMKAIRAMKSVVEDPQGIAFSVTTPTNVKWTIEDLIKEVREEHEYMQKNPPKPKTEES